MKTQVPHTQTHTLRAFHSTRKSQKMSEVNSQSCLVHAQGWPFQIPHGLEHWKYFLLGGRQDKGSVENEALSSSAVETTNTALRFSTLNFYWEYKGT